MRTAVLLRLPEISNQEPDREYGSNLPKAIARSEPVPSEPEGSQTAEADGPKARQLISSKELSQRWDIPESTLRYWRCAGIGLPYVKLGGRIKYDLADVERYVRANKRIPSVRAHGG